MPTNLELESHLKRWVNARIIDYSTADRIRGYESSETPRRQSNWMVILAIAFGAVMLAAGVLLFVAAHWDNLSPTQRFLLVLTMVAGFHLAAGALIDRLKVLGIALHAIGTIALGAGIFLAGQIFNLEEHWPGGIMLWALGSLIAWLILRDTAQATLAAILIPGWIASELSVRYEHFLGGEAATAEFIFLISILYLGTRTQDRHFARALHILGGTLLIPAFFGVYFTSYHRYNYLGTQTAMSSSQRLLVFGIAFAIPLLAAWLTRGRRAAFEFTFAIWLLAAARLAASTDDVFMNVALHGWCALAAIGMVVWGVRDQSRTFINMGVLCFAIDIIAFYFSSVMDKLGRSASLIGFGLIFLLGGWYLEKLRRRLILRTAGGAQ